MRLFDEPKAGSLDVQLANQDVILKRVDRKLFEGKGTFAENPSSPEEVFTNQLLQIQYAGQKLKIQAHGCASGSPDIFAHSRAKLEGVLVERNIRPSEMMSATFHEEIDEFGNLDDMSPQACMGSLGSRNSCTGSFGFGPYWVILQPEARGIDRRSGIPSDCHIGYLVPTDLDRKVVTQAVMKQSSDPTTQSLITKIETYEEFLQKHQNLFSNPKWYEEWTADDNSYEEADRILNEIRSQPGTWQDHAKIVLERVQNSSDDIKVKSELLIGYEPRFGGTITENAELAKPYLLNIALNETSPPTFRRQAIYGLGECRDPEIADPLIHIAQSAPEDEVKIAAINTLSYFPKDTVPSFLASVARSQDYPLLVRRYALLNLRYDHPESFKTIEHFIRDGDDQEKRIALHAFLRTPLFIVPQSILDSCKQLASTTTRKDVLDGAENVLKRHAYIVEPLLPEAEQLAQDPEKLRDLIGRKANRVLGKEEYKNPWLVIMQAIYTALNQGRIKLEPLVVSNTEPGTPILETYFGPKVGLTGDIRDGEMSIEFGGWGTWVKGGSSTIKKIVFV